jgi:hypothetical protein
MYERSDPKILGKIETNTIVAKKAINRWVDNLCELGDWIKDKKGGLT